MPVAKEDVIAAYRLLLGREPSDGESVAWLHIASVAELRRLFIASDEFRASAASGAFKASAPSKEPPSPQRLPNDVPPISIEWEAATETQAWLTDHVTRTWTALGKDEPHWSVLSAEQFKSENIDRNADTFYASGAFDAKLVAAILARHSLTPADLGRAVEYGCGVGRVTPYLAALFREVVAIDVSESHLALAAQSIARSGQRNVRLVLARAPEFGMVAPFDLWFSFIVLQHNPPPVIAFVLRRMFAMLAPGGVAIFQVPTYVPAYRFDVAQYLAAPKTGSIEVHCLPQQAIFQLADAAGCVPLEVREDSAMGYPWLSNTFVFRKHRR